MGKYVSKYGGELMTFPLGEALERVDKKDYLITEGIPGHSFGTLAIRTNSEDYWNAVVALEDNTQSVMLAAIEDPESASPYLFIRRVSWNGLSFSFTVIFNAQLMKREESSEGIEEAYDLRLGDIIDPGHKCTYRIVYAPGRRIEWTDEEIAHVFAQL